MRPTESPCSCWQFSSTGSDKEGTFELFFEVEKGNLLVIHGYKVN